MNNEGDINMSVKKPIVFAIMPFKDEILSLYDKLKSDFENEFTFINAGDLDNQRNILQDIVEGIYHANIVIADLTGLNPNVFYELGLAHAMNKKVIIIAQDLGELPFDIKSYRAIEYSLLFHKLPTFLTEVKKLLDGAIDGSTKFGNPVSDFIPDFFAQPSVDVTEQAPTEKMKINDLSEIAEESEEKGYLDYIADITDNSSTIKEEIDAMGTDLKEMSQAINQTSNEVNRVKAQSGNVDHAFVRSVCRKLAGPIEENATKMREHIGVVTSSWSIVENSYLGLLDNSFMQTKQNAKDIESSTTSLADLRNTIKETDGKIDRFISVLQSSIGIERKLTKAITSLITELEAYLSMTEIMASSIDRIIAKSEVVAGNVRNSAT